jgi:hypothetical protein
MARISGPTGKGPLAPEPFHTAPGVPSPENTKLPRHAETEGDRRKFGDLLPHVAPHSTLGEVAAAFGKLNTTQAGVLASFVALSGGPNSKLGSALLKSGEKIDDASLPTVVALALAQTLVEEGYTSSST